jgi:hypothetical protein
MATKKKSLTQLKKEIKSSYKKKDFNKTYSKFAEYSKRGGKLSTSKITGSKAIKAQEL